MLYRWVMSDMSAMPDATSDTLQGSFHSASPPGAGAACVHGCVDYRDAALGLALCAYIFYTTSFIVSFHLEQSQGDGYISDNKRVYVDARRPHLLYLLRPPTVTSRHNRSRTRITGTPTRRSTYSSTPCCCRPP